LKTDGRHYNTVTTMRALCKRVNYRDIKRETER